jgi:hypothetical protein
MESKALIKLKGLDLEVSLKRIDNSIIVQMWLINKRQPTAYGSNCVEVAPKHIGSIFYKLLIAFWILAIGVN